MTFARFQMGATFYKFCFLTDLQFLGLGRDRAEGIGHRAEGKSPLGPPFKKGGKVARSG